MTDLPRPFPSVLSAPPRPKPERPGPAIQSAPAVAAGADHG